MIELNRHIEILLLSNDCVIVPDFGGFVAHHVDARYDGNDSSFLPPLRTLGFNSSLKLNDHLLVQSYIESYDISYPEALRRIENEVEELKQHLENEGEYELFDLGTLSINEEGNYQFAPCESGILSPSLYGLSSFEMLPLSAQAETEETESPTAIVATEQEEDKAPVVDMHPADEDEAIVIRMSWVRRVAVVAAAILMFFVFSTPIDNSRQFAVQEGSIFPVTSVAAIEKDSVVNEELTATSDSTELTQQAEQNVQAEQELKAPETSYTIIVASQTPLRHANEFIARLNKNGFEDAHVMEMANTEKVRVGYGSYGSEEEARESLRSLRAQNRSVFGEAWVLKTN